MAPTDDELLELQLPPLDFLHVHEVVNNELVNKLRQAELKLRQVQRCGIKSETQAAHCASQLRQLQLENGVLRLEQAALAASLAAANAACHRQQDELQALRDALYAANMQRSNARREADELRSKFEVALQVQLVCLKGHDQAKGQLDDALQELQKLRKERSPCQDSGHGVDVLADKFSEMAVRQQ